MSAAPLSAAVEKLAGVGLWEWSPSTGALQWSDGLYSLHGLTPPEFVPTLEGWLDRILPEDRGRVRRELERAARDGASLDLEMRVRHADGGVRVLRCRGDVQRGEDGGVAVLHGACQDVTERRDAESAIRASEQGYRTIFALASDAMFLHDARTGEVVDANQEACALIGCSLEELRRAGLARLSTEGSPFDAAKAASWIHLAATGEPQRFEWLVQRSDGGGTWVEVKLQRIRIGDADRVLASVRDITDRKRSEEELRRARDELERRVEERTRALAAEVEERKLAQRALQRREEHFRLLIENSTDVATILAADGTSLYQSPSVERVLGYRPEEMAGTSAFERVHPDDLPRAREAVARMASRPGTTVTVEVRYRHRSGEWRTVESSGRTLLPDSAASGLVVNSRDVTERRRAEDQLRFQKALLEAQGEASIDGILLVSPAGEILSCNRRFGEMWEIPDSVLELRSEERALECVLERVEDPEHLVECVRHLRARPAEQSRDEVRLRDGRIFDRYTGPVLSATGEAYGRIWLFRDVTEWREADAALRRSEQRFRSVVESSSDVVSLLDATGIVQYQSPALLRVFGYDQEELVGRSSLEYVHPDDVAEVAARLSDLVAHPGETRTASFRFRHRDGRWMHVESLGTTLSPTGPEEGVIVNTRDITDRKEAEVRLRETKRFLENLIASSPGVIFRGSGESFQTTYISPNAEAVLGYSAERFLAEPHLWVDRTHPDDVDTVTSTLERAISGGARQLNYEYRFRHVDGTYRNLLASVRFERDPATGEVEVLGYTFDISPLKEAEAALRAAKEEAEAAREVAERASLAKSEFLSRMSHELRTPMNSILGFAQLLARNPLPPDQAKGVDHIVRAGRHLLNLINEVLDIARIEADRSNLSLEPVHLATVVSDALTMMRPVAAQHGCALEERIPPEADRYVRADRQRLTQVVLNLLSNAIKYNRPGGSVRLECSVREDSPEAGRAALRVIDTGVGIAPERMPELFVPFARLEAERSGIEGTGLGLALSRRLIEAMGGEIRVESTPGEGSTFEVELPLAARPVVRTERAGPEPRPAAPEAPALPATILYIEDNLANLSLVETIFADQPELQLVPALQGRLGLELAREHSPDLVLLDLHLPDLTGEEVLAELRADPRTSAIPVVVISADATARQIARLRAAGAVEYLTKPLDIDQFRAAVADALSHRHTT